MQKIALGLIPVAFLGGLFTIIHTIYSSHSSDATCTVGGCPFELHENDSGKTFTYTVTSRFAVFLDERHNPRGHLVCQPEGIIGHVSNVPSAVPPLYAASFQALAPGMCDLTSEQFAAKIVVVDQH